MEAPTRNVADGTAHGWLRLSGVEALYWLQYQGYRLDLGRPPGRGRPLEPVGDLRDSVEPHRLRLIEAAVARHLAAAGLAQ